MACSGVNSTFTFTFSSYVGTMMAPPPPRHLSNVQKGKKERKKEHWERLEGLTAVTWQIIQTQGCASPAVQLVPLLRSASSVCNLKLCASERILHCLTTATASPPADKTRKRPREKFDSSPLFRVALPPTTNTKISGLCSTVRSHGALHSGCLVREAG